MKKILFLVLLGVISGCSGSDDNTSGSDYDRSAMLANWADNIIIPAYDNYDLKIDTLSAAGNTFISSATEDNLKALRLAWAKAYIAFQQTSAFNIGKSEAIFFKESANTYPADASGIESNIASGTYNLAAMAQFDKQGFPGLDYLLNGLSDGDSEVIAFYTTNANAARYRQYLSDIIARLKINAGAVASDWHNGYRDSFVASSGTSVASSVSKLTNAFTKNFERDIRLAKVGIPAGKLSAGTAYPEKVEAYYAGNLSNTLLIAALASSRSFFEGRHFSDGQAGPGLRSYLDYVKAGGDQPLSNIIDNAFTEAISFAETLDSSYSQQIIINNSKMLTLYDHLQNITVYLKTNMLQALNITVDYVDGDGD